MKHGQGCRGKVFGKIIEGIPANEFAESRLKVLRFTFPAFCFKNQVYLLNITFSPEYYFNELKVLAFNLIPTSSFTSRISAFTGLSPGST